MNMKKILFVLFIMFTFMFTYVDNSKSSGVSKIITNTTKKVGKFFSKKPIDKKTGKYLLGGAVVNDSINNNKDKDNKSGK